MFVQILQRLISCDKNYLLYMFTNTSYQTGSEERRSPKCSMHILQFVIQPRHSTCFMWGGLAQLVVHQTLGGGVPGSSPARDAIHCGLEQVTFLHLIVYICIYVLSRNKKLYRAYECM